MDDRIKKIPITLFRKLHFSKTSWQLRATIGAIPHEMRPPARAPPILQAPADANPESSQRLWPGHHRRACPSQSPLP